MDKKTMQKILGFMRKAVTDYKMIQPGDRIAVGVSGGKDSTALLAGLGKLRSFWGTDYSLVAVTLDPCFNGVPVDYSPIQQLCEQIGVEYVVKRTDIGQVVFDLRRESNPCSLCARMRRGALHDTALEHGCNKIALGHHSDDAVETFLMNLFYEGRIGCFSPVTYLSRKNLTMIRPLIYAPEAEIRRAVRRSGLPVVKSKCPADGGTKREEMKAWIKTMERERRNLSKLVFGAMIRAHISGW